MIKILIVEDEEPIANLIRMNLVKAGYQCETAFDGEAAADAISERTFDLILLDIMLPKLNGYEVLEYAKSVDIPVIFLTAMGETQQKVKGCVSARRITSPNRLRSQSCLRVWRRCCAAVTRHSGSCIF